MKRLLVQGSFALSLLAWAPSAFSEGSVEAVIGPGIGLQKISESWKSGSRTQYSLDFARISAGVSLNVIYGSGLGYSDYGAILRLFGRREILPDSDKLSVWYGLGAGARYTSEMTAAVTGLSSSTAYGRALISPFARVLYDLNGWIAPFLEFSYDVAVYHFGDSPTGLDKLTNSFVGTIGVAIEIER